jgi:hypothetical protein
MSAFDHILAAETPAFARAVTAIVTGDVPALHRVLGAEPRLVHARSTSAHHASLLHYVAANGIEDALQRPVPNADEIADGLLAAGAVVDAPCDAYGGRWSTTMDLLVSSDHPCEAGVTGRLVRLLCDYGAAVEGPANDGSPLATALAFGIIDGVQALLACGARTDNPIFAAAAGDTAWLQAWLDGTQAGARPVPDYLPLSSDRRIAAEQALAFAAMCGQLDVIRLLLRQGTDVNAVPPGSHWIATALHAAAIQGQVAAVSLLLEGGADPTIRDTQHQGTPLEWTDHARGPRRTRAREAALILLSRG